MASSSTIESEDMMDTVMEHLQLAWFDAEASYRRFEETGNTDDITQVISHCEKVLSLVPPDFDVMPDVFYTLGNAYLHRFERTSVLQDIHCAISHSQKSVDSTPCDHTDYPSRCINLGNSYIRRFERTGVLKDIDCAISYHQKAIKFTPSGHPDLPIWFNNLGTSFSTRFEHNGDLQDIDCSLFYHQKAVDCTTSGHVDLPSRLNNLGNAYLRRFKRTGVLQDIDSAISHHQIAIYNTPYDDTALPKRFNNLGNSYAQRFDRTGVLQDIEHAISHHNKAVDSTPSGHSDLPNWLNNVGNSYLRRFERTKVLQDIDCAIFHHQKALESTLSVHVARPNRFTNLGNSHLRRFKCTGVLQDVHLAISFHHNAVQSTISGHADHPALLNNLGTSYISLFERTGDLQNIDCAISHLQRAVELTPSGHADFPSWFNNLGESYFRRFNKSNDISDVHNSIASYRRGANLHGSPSTRLKCATNAVLHSSVYDRSQCLADFALAINLLSEVAGLEQIIHRRYANLHRHSDLVKSAVATALDLSRPDLALEWLEEGRCLVWNQLKQLRTPIDDLRTTNRSLADRFMTAARALESYGSRSTSSASSLAEEINLQNDTQNHTRYAAQYKQILDEIRSLAKFHEFLRPPKATHILDSLPSNGPVIIFNLHETRCDALALVARVKKPRHIPLVNFSLEQAEELQKTLRFDLLKQREVDNKYRMPELVGPHTSSMSFVLEELWVKVVHPILSAMGYHAQLNLSDRRRIWWCPTGPLAFLPLHAAGVYGSSYKPGSCIPDFAVSSYTPTVQSLKSSSSSAVPSHTMLLLVNPNTPGLSPIPFTGTETHGLKALMDRSAIKTLLLEDTTANTDAVKKELNTHSWVHFACHGIQDMADPLKSGVHLYDDRLELLEIMRQKLSNPQMAFLSACQTSTGDLKLSEEVVHLAAGMLAAGYCGVIGTMWTISDPHGPEFAKWFYTYLLEDKGSVGLDSTRAAYALDYATRKVRESLGESDAAFLTWVPYVHFGY